jgi:hypothetical protein
MVVMRYLCLFLILAFAGPAFAAAPKIETQISKLEFQGVHFGDFPSVDMVCVRGLCPVGELGVGISTNSRIPPAYTQQTAITHYNGARISTPEFHYFDDQMYMVRFNIECKSNGVDECVVAVKERLDAEYGLFPIVDADSKKSASPKVVEEFVTESGSLVAIVRGGTYKGMSFPSVRIVDRTLMDQLRKFFNPNYVPPRIEILDAQNSN